MLRSLSSVAKSNANFIWNSPAGTLLYCFYYIWHLCILFCWYLWILSRDNNISCSRWKYRTRRPSQVSVFFTRYLLALYYNLWCEKLKNNCHIRPSPTYAVYSRYRWHIFISHLRDVKLTREDDWTGTRTGVRIRIWLMFNA